MSLEQQQAFHKNNIDREVAGLQPMTWEAYTAQMGGGSPMPMATGNQVAPAPMMQMNGQPMMMQSGMQGQQMMMQPGMQQPPMQGQQMHHQGAPAFQSQIQNKPIKKFNSKICGCIDFWE